MLNSHTVHLEVSRIPKTVKNPDELQCYRDTISGPAIPLPPLTRMGLKNCKMADIFIWLLRILEEYLNTLERKAPEALVVFGYFSAAC